MTIENLAKAMVKNTNIKIKITGIRPAEKIHEIMISDEEANFTVKKGNYFAIKSMLPELTKENNLKKSLFGEFSSADNCLDVTETIKLLEKNKLLPGMDIPKESGEFLV